MTPRDMRLVGRLALAAVAALLVTGGVVALSYVPYTPDHGSAALIRLSWRARGERIETCRRLTPEELENIPAHMRQPEICKGITAPYRLRVYVAGELRTDEMIGGSGARRDGLLYVFREFETRPGIHDVHVVFERAIAPGERETDEREGERREERERREDDEREGREARRANDRREQDREREHGAELRPAPSPRQRRAEELPPRLELRETATLGLREVLLITFDPESGALVRLPAQRDEGAPDAALPPLPSPPPR